MKKYWKSILLIVIIISTIGIFYFQMSNFTEGFAQMKFEKETGDEKAVQNVMIYGDLFYGMHSEAFQVSHEGTTYLRDEKFSKRLSGYYSDPYIERLQVEYRTFMRGKVEDPIYFYENEDVLAYGYTPFNTISFENDQFDIAILNKKTEDTISFSLPVPNRGDYRFVEPKGIYIKANQLSIITLNEKINNKAEDNTTVHLYTFDVEKEKLTDEQIIGSLDYSHVEKYYYHINLIRDESSIIISNSKISQNFDDETYSETATLEKVIGYNIETKKAEEITFLEDELGIPFALDDEQLYFANRNEGRLMLKNYDMEKEKVTEELEVKNIDSLLTVTDILQAKVKDGKLYFVPSQQELGELPSILVVDLHSLTVDYAGKVEDTRPPRKNRVERYFSYPQLENG